MIKNAVLTGPTGAIGIALTANLAARGVDTYVICRPDSPRNERIKKHPCIHKIECDLTEISKLPKLLGKRIEAFFHLAWVGKQDSRNRMDMYLQNRNISLTLDTAYAAKALGVKVFVGAGSQAEYGRIDGVIHPNSPVNPISGYGMAKLCAGQMTRVLCREWGIRHIWPRIVSVYGINDAPKTLVSTIISTLQRGESPQLTAGEQSWDYLYAGDAAEAFYLMAEKGRDGAVYVLGSGKTRKLKEFMLDIQGLINKDIPLGLGKIPYLSDQAMHLQADIENLQRDTGWQPKTDFITGIKEVLNYING